MFKRRDLENQVSKIPNKILWCKNCTMSNQRPRIIFDENGICSACKYYEYKKTINWKTRESELVELLDLHRSKDNSWDVVDSWRAKHLWKKKGNKWQLKNQIK